MSQTSAALIESLAGKRIINTRAKDQASTLSEKLTALGAEVLSLPTIEIIPAAPGGELDTEITDLENYGWLIFTSTNSVDFFFKRLIALHRSTSPVKNIRIASIGPGTTAALSALGVTASITATDSVGEGLAASLKSAGDWKGIKVLLPRAEKARDILPDTLNALGADLTVVTAYRTVVPGTVDRSIIETIVHRRYDCCTFTSASTFENLVKIIGQNSFSRMLSSFKAASIGPSTSRAIRKAGIEPMVEAKVHTIPGLVEAISDYFGS